MDYLKEFNQSFYQSREWRSKREEIIIRDNYECQLCKDEGRMTPATEVHHIKTYKDRPDLALTDDNLISLCTQHHKDQHPEKGFQAIERDDIHPERWE